MAPQPLAPINPRAPFIWHGGDYNPEQWPPEIWDADMALMQQSHFNIATVGVFSWVSLQPEEDRFTFEWLDTIFEKLHAAGRSVWRHQAQPSRPGCRSATRMCCARAKTGCAIITARGSTSALIRPTTG